MWINPNSLSLIQSSEVNLPPYDEYRFVAALTIYDKNGNYVGVMNLLRNGKHFTPRHLVEKGMNDSEWVPAGFRSVKDIEAFIKEYEEKGVLPLGTAGSEEIISKYCEKAAGGSGAGPEEWEDHAGAEDSTAGDRNA